MRYLICFYERIVTPILWQGTNIYARCLETKINITSHESFSLDLIKIKLIV